ncbi:site-specific DNA-methyltransferase, partial [Bradyrhizobium sp. AUGA SZCCT0160]|nr:site-specific DNA-methyltransferase [Bradyrhizobium sp. AUGA SZCCT0160]
SDPRPTAKRGDGKSAAPTAARVVRRADGRSGRDARACCEQRAIGSGSFARDDDGHGHGTQKPVDCMRRPIENNSSPGQAVYDPFSGSGTTIIAAEMTGRSCFAIDIDPAYVDVTVQRWQAFTGEVARLDQDGRSFAEMEAERRHESVG